MYQWQKDIWTASVKLWGKLDFVYWSDIWEWKLFSCLLSLAALRKFSTSYIEMWFFLGIIAFLDFKLSPCVECHIVFSGYSPGVWAFSADISELTSHSVFVGVVLYAYEDGTASKFQNVGTKSSDAGRLPKKYNMAIIALFTNFKCVIFLLFIFVIFWRPWLPGIDLGFVLQISDLNVWFAVWCHTDWIFIDAF